MRTLVRLSTGLLLLLVLADARSALADPEAHTDHAHQFGLSFDVGSGYRALFPYASSNVSTCGTSHNTSNTACTDFLPAFMDLGITYGLSPKFDLLLEDRVGLGADFTGSHAETLALGFRYYPDPEGVAKLMAGLELVADFTNFKSGPDAGAKLGSTDFAAHPFGGLQLDFTRNVGAYIAGGVTCGFIRWLRFELDGFAGVQVRFP